MSDNPWWHDRDERAEALGSGAQEAAKLFTALKDRILQDPAAARAGMSIMDTLASLRDLTAGDEHESAHARGPGEAPECAYCPLCQAISRAQRISPESVEKVAGAAMEFADAVRRALVDDQGAQEFRTVPLDDDEQPGRGETSEEGFPGERLGDEPGDLAFEAFSDLLDDGAGPARADSPSRD